jgi:rhodanese-related sulfurtransferase
MENKNIVSCIEKERVLEMLKKSDSKILFLDVRSAEEFNALHIPGALHLPLEMLSNWSGSVDYIYITVCGKGGGRSQEAAIQLLSMGYEAHFLCGGTFGFLNSNL